MSASGSYEMILKAELLKIIPALCSTSHKGSCGRVGVIGGSQEYTGAPYFAAIAALKCGADLSHVFCPTPAASVIKSYSPDLIVHPLLGCGSGNVPIAPLQPWFERLHSTVLGPGLGRDLEPQSVLSIVQSVLDLQLPLVIDADGLYYIGEMSQVIFGKKNVVLTPNIVELKRLEKAVGVDEDVTGIEDRIKQLCQHLGGVTLVCKNTEDVISDGELVLKCTQEGSNRRCGGQGDLLSGSLATFLAWCSKVQSTSISPTLLASYAGCCLIRETNRLGFSKHGRGLVTQDMISFIPQAFSNLFENFKCPPVFGE